MGISLQNVVKRFGAFTAVNGVSAQIADGEFFVMLGPSGCGKTTTLRMIAGLELPSDGRVFINGKDVTYEEPRHRDIAMAFQDYGLYPHLSVFQNIEFPLRVRKVATAERRRKVEDTAGKLGISDYLGRKPGQISGGQRQRVSLARALVRSPRVFLMDEPLSNLDAKLRATMRTEIKKLVTSLGITTVYVTHDQVEAMSMADRIAVMSKGDMVQVSSPLELYDRPKTYFVADFIGSPPMNLYAATKNKTCSLQFLMDALPPAEAKKTEGAGDAFFLGVRPEHFTLNPVKTKATIEAEVDFVEPLGQNTNVFVTCQGQRFVVVTDRTRAKIGDRVGIGVDADKIRVVQKDKV